MVCQGLPNCQVFYPIASCEKGYGRLHTGRYEKSDVDSRLRSRACKSFTNISCEKGLLKQMS
jgi:hypothetical protein